jgi:hypothetical protein
MSRLSNLKLYTLGGITLSVIVVGCGSFLQGVLRVGRQKAAISQLYKIREAQEQTKTSHGRYGTLVELAEAGLLDAGIAWGSNSYFRYWVSDLTPTTFCAHADRQSAQAGNCDFNLCEDAVLSSRCDKKLGSVPRVQDIKERP